MPDKQHTVTQDRRGPPGRSAPRLSLPLAVFLLLAGVYLLALSGHTYSADEETMLAVTRALLAAGTVDLRPAEAAGAPLAALRPGVGDGRYSPYGVLPSLLALPLQALGGLAAVLGPGAADYASRLAVTALNGPLSAAAAALLAAWALRLGAARRWALALALLYGLCTFALVYSRTFFSEPLAALLILWGAERAHNAACSTQHAEHGTQTSRGVFGPVGRDLFLSGLACGLLLTTRIAAGVAVPVIGLYALWVCWRGAGSTFAGARVQTLALGIGHWALGLLPGLALLLWYNLARFGAPLASGYGSEAALFTTPLLVGLQGLLLSPGKSVLLYAPPLLLALPGAAALWRRGERAVVLLCLGLFLSHLLLYARWGEWQGGGVWGPRFLLPVVAPLLVLAAGLWPRAARPRPALLAGVALLALLGFAGNLGGALLNFGTYVVLPGQPDKLATLAGSPLVGHWRTLGERWGSYLAPPPVCRLGDGLYPSEDPGGAPLPRRTGGAGALRCTTGEPLRLRFTLDDRRPPAAPPSELRLLLGGRELAAPPQGQLREYRLLLPPGAASLTLAARTWNPVAVGFSDRDDELGPQLGGLQGVTAGGAQLAVADGAVAPLPARPRPRWAWYYDPPNRHLADHWAWYMPRSELAGPGAWLAGGLIALLGAGLAAAGARGLWRAVTP
jgi:hypothetical protein